MGIRKLVFKQYRQRDRIWLWACPAKTKGGDGNVKSEISDCVPVERGVEAKERLNRVRSSPVPECATTSHVLLGSMSIEHAYTPCFRERTRPDKGWTHDNGAKHSRAPLSPPIRDWRGPTQRFFPGNLTGKASCLGAWMMPLANVVVKGLPIHRLQFQLDCDQTW